MSAGAGRSRSLQVVEAQARRALLDITAYDVELDLAGDESTFASVTTLDFTSAGGPTFVDLKPVRVGRVELNGQPLDVDLLEAGRLPIDSQPGVNRLVVEATMRFRNDGEGLHRSVDPADGRHYVYGMCFMDAAPSVFACFDQPDLKAPYTLHVRAPEDWTVVANGPGSQVEPGRWEFATTRPLSTYFVTVVAGPWHVLRAEHDGIPLGLSSRASLAGALDADADELFTMTGQCFDELHRLFGIRYPFGDYHQAFVPEFNAGAMENPGCVTLRDPMLFDSRATRGARINRATTVAHEMAHQWFGNIVTPRWWDDLWLNESFAEYLGNRVAAEATDYSDAWLNTAWARRPWGMRADRRPTTHPVAGTGAVDALAALQDFDGISYAKGSSVLRQLATGLGDEVFLAGVVEHIEGHRFGNATMADLFGSWERAGASDLSGFTDSWLRTAGPDLITLDREAGILRREPPAEHPAERGHALRLAVHTADGWRAETLKVIGPETAYDAGADPVLVDPWLDTWAQTPPDPSTLAALPALVVDLDDDQLLAGIWAGLRTGLELGLLDPANVLAVAEARLPVEDAEDNELHLMPWLLEVLAPLGGPHALGRLHAAATSRLAAAPTGSDAQLAALRAAIDTCVEPAPLRELLGRTPAGIDLDTALRWRVLGRLAALGATTRDELGEALSVDPTGAARIAWTTAMAALPDEEAKSWAWARFTGEVDVPNYELNAAGLGLWQGGQEELTAPYVERYLDELPATVEVRSGWSLAESAEYFYPRTADSPRLLQRTRELADSPGLDLSLRRRLLDLADDLARRIVVRERFPAAAS